eukprot:scaffold7789_cov200-Pinguiococcus_pyrenoidosus.AAC.4
MDQTYVAGLGNIFRAEVLYKARIHPEQPGKSITRDQFDLLWWHSVECMRRAYQVGSIVTVDPDDADRLGPPWTRRYVYNQEHCGNCASKIKSWPDRNRRTVYACLSCQPLIEDINDQEEDASIPDERKAVVSSAASSKVFRSLCARDRSQGAYVLPPEKMKVAEIRAELLELGLDAKGKKAALVKRLSSARQVDQKAPCGANSQETLPPPSAPGTADLEPASASAAMLEKMRAGENRAVEHVAEADDETKAIQNAEASTQDAAFLALKRLKVAELRAELKGLGLDSKGKKAVLLERLKQARSATAPNDPSAASVAESSCSSGSSSRSDGKVAKPEMLELKNTETEHGGVALDVSTAADQDGAILQHMTPQKERRGATAPERGAEQKSLLGKRKRKADEDTTEKGHIC